MANWTALSNAIRQVIYSNGTRDITGQILQTALLNIVNNLGSLPTFGGTATPSTNPGVHDGPVFYIATTEGTYSNFNNIAIAKAEVPSVLVCMDNTWSKQVIGTSVAADIEALITSLSTETNRATATESALQSALTAETSRATAKEQELQEAIADQNDEIEDFKSAITDQVNNYQPIEITGDVTNAADEEDLTSENGLLKIKNRSALNGMGYVILRRGSSFASQVTLPNTIYEVRYDFDLNGAEVTIPANCVLQFNGGSIGNGHVIYNGTKLQGEVNLTSILVDGTLANKEIFPELFGAKGDGVTDDSVALQKWLDYGGNLSLAAGKTYIIGTIQYSGVDVYRNSILLAKSNTSIQGNGATIKLKSGVLTSANTHFIIADDIENFVVENVVFDGNGVNNVTPSTASSTYWRSAMFLRISGGRNITIRGNVFKDCAGHNMIVLSNGPHNRDNNYPDVYEQALIENNEFRNGGKYLSDGETVIYNQYNPDFSFLYTDFKYTIVRNNQFVNWDLDKGTVGSMSKEDRYKYLSGITDSSRMQACGGVELHNSHQQSIGNTFMGCLPAMYVCANTGDITDTIVKDNVIKDCIAGVTIVGADNMVQHKYEGIKIIGNTMTLVSSVFSPTYGISYMTTTGSNPTKVTNTLIEQNIISSSQFSIDNIAQEYQRAYAVRFTASHYGTNIKSNRIVTFIGPGMALGALVTGASLEDVRVTDNYISDTCLKTDAINVRNTAITFYNDQNNYLNKIVIRDNTVRNSQLIVKENDVIVKSKSLGGAQYAITMYGTISDMEISNTILEGIPQAYNTLPEGAVYSRIVTYKDRNGHNKIVSGEMFYEVNTNTLFARGFGYTTPVYGSNNKVDCTGVSGTNVVTASNLSELKIGDYIKVSDNSNHSLFCYILKVDDAVITLSGSPSFSATGIEQVRAAIQEFPLNYGNSSQFPTLTSYRNVGHPYYDVIRQRMFFWGADHWIDANGFGKPNKAFGTESDAPTDLTNSENGYPFYNRTAHRQMYWLTGRWVDERGLKIDLLNGDSSSRPTLTSADKGYQYFDIDLGKPIYWQGTKWVDATGADLV